MAALLTAAEVAEHLRKSTEFVCDELTRKNLRGSKIGREWRVDPADLAAYINGKANVAKVRRPA